VAKIKLEDLSQTRDRPLFSPSRRPPPPTIEAPPPAVPVMAEAKPPANEPPPFDLVGVVVGGDARFVLLANHGGGAVSRLRPGDEQDGWRVGEISTRSVVLEREGREESLALAVPVASPNSTTTPDPKSAPEVAERRTDDGDITPGPVRDEYKRLMKQLAVKR
jgi:general secretion pathway protein N